MSEANGKVCCNCRHCIRVRDEKGNHVRCECDINGVYLGYIAVMTHWCRRWVRDKSWDESEAKE